MTNPALGIVADDLSGAAECAVHALVRVSRSTVLLVADSASQRDPRPAQLETVVTVDTDSRRLERDGAVRAVRAAAALVAGAPVVVKKVDSLLRGHLAAEVTALAAELGRTPVVAVANPALDRVVRDGVLHVGGTPLHETDLWAVEPTPAPSRVAEALHPLATVLVPHTVVALGVAAVTQALTEAIQTGLVPVCDAVTDADLDVVHAAAAVVAASGGHGALLVGSGALADAAVRALPPEPRHGTHSDDDADDVAPIPRHGALSAGAARSVLFVLGTRAPGLPDQLGQLSAAHSAQTVLVQPDALLADPEAVGAELAGLSPDGVVVVALDPAAAVDAARSRALTDALADAVAPLLDGYDVAFLSGGETARTVLDRLHVPSLDVVAEVGNGTVVSARPGGRLVVTRPGSFGGPASLVDVAAHLLGAPTSRQPEPTHTATRAVPDATTEENS